MFGFDLETTIAAGIALAALLAIIPLFLAKSYAPLAGALAIGALAWSAGGLTNATFSAFAAGAVAAIVAFVDGILAGFGVGLPIPTGALLLLLIALLFLSARRNGKKK